MEHSIPIINHSINKNMFINPYYFVFCLLYKKLSKLPKTGVLDNTEGEFLFKIFSFLFIIFFPHFFYTEQILKDLGVRLLLFPNVPRGVFGIGSTMLFYLINYLLFGRKYRFKKIIERYEGSSHIEYAFNLLLLVLYFSIPLILLMV